MQNKTQRVTLNRNGLNMTCFYGPSGRLIKKIEKYGGKTMEYDYFFDVNGHLLHAKCNGSLQEAYHYNHQGQRVWQCRIYPEWCRHGLEEALRYNKQGQLEKVDSLMYAYDQNGALRERRSPFAATKFFYGNDTLLDKVVLPTGDVLRYEYDASNPLGPAKRWRNDNLSCEYKWLDELRLASCIDHDHHLEYSFLYNNDGLLDRMRIAHLPYNRVWQAPPGADRVKLSADWLCYMVAQNRKNRIAHLFKNGPLDLLCGLDQVGTLKLLSTTNGQVVKLVERNSFGETLFDSLPDLLLPIGFAGGLQGY